jgi:N6-L-threonylcarbamoyladenine synthase
MGLPYPGGPLIDKYARDGNANAFRFPETVMPDWTFHSAASKRPSSIF